MTTPPTSQQTIPEQQPQGTGEASISGATQGTEPARNPDGTFAASGQQEYRYPQDYPISYLRGLTPDEAANMFDGLYQNAVTGYANPSQPSNYAQPNYSQPDNPANPYPADPPQPQYPGYPQSGPPTPQVQPGAPQPPALPTQDEWLQSPEIAQQKLVAYNNWQMQQTYEPRMQQFWESQGQTNLGIAKSQFNDDFNRWGPEIVSTLKQLAPSAQNWTPENISHVVNLVRGRHAKEIQNELVDAEVKKRIEGGTLRPSSDVPGTSITQQESIDLNSDELPMEYRQQLQRVGITPDERGLRELDKFLIKFAGPDCNIQEERKKWFEQAKSGNVVIEGASGFRREVPQEQKNG